MLLQTLPLILISDDDMGRMDAKTGQESSGKLLAWCHKAAPVGIREAYWPSAVKQNCDWERKNHYTANLLLDHLTESLLSRVVKFGSHVR